MAMGRVLPQVIFTITWLSCSTYLIGSFSYRNTDYVIQHSDVYLANMIMYVCCFITLTLAITGCMCLKANVTHVCCIALFCLLICTLIPTSCIYGLVRLKQARKINERYIKNEMIQYYKAHNELSPLLIAVQRDQDCCGLYSSMDYREFIYPRDTCKNITQDIPESCVKLNEIYKHCSKSKKPDDCKVQMYLENVITFTDPTMNKELMSKTTEEEKVQYKCDNVKSDNAKLITKGIVKKNAYWERGCMSTIIENSMDLRDTHYFFFYLMMILGVMMLASFLTHWFETVPTRLVSDDTASLKAVKASSRNSKMSNARRAKPGAPTRPKGKGV